MFIVKIECLVFLFFSLNINFLSHFYLFFLKIRENICANEICMLVCVCVCFCMSICFWQHTRFSYVKEPPIADSWYELLSVLHMMAMVSLSAANRILIPKDQGDAYERKVSEGVFWLIVHLCVWAHSHASNLKIVNCFPSEHFLFIVYFAARKQDLLDCL